MAIGTTAARTLETAARGGGLAAWSGPTDLFIRPGFEFRAVDCLLTNFHMPRTTLMVLVSTFASRGLIATAYEEAIRATATPEAPWYVVPADNKWFTRLVVVSALVLTLDDMKLAYPKVEAAQTAALAKARAALLAED